MAENAVNITPDTKLLEVLDAYPQLAPVVSHLVPSFARLHTPELREAVARSLTLEQLAVAGNTSPVNMVMALRMAAGLNDAGANGKSPANAPEWVKSGSIVKELDARPLLAQGHHPKGEVMGEFSALQTGQIFLLVTPFVPAPLVELGKQHGLSTWTRQGEAGRFETYFGKVN